MAKPGRGWAALLVTREGSHYGMTSSLRAFTTQVDGIGAVWFRPSALQAPHISGGISTPLSRVNMYGQCDLVAANADWWIADHLYEDQFAGAEVTVYRETRGTLGAVLFAGYVLDKRGVQADGARVTFSCTDVLGYFLPGKTVGGKVALDLDTFPNLEPPPVAAVTMEAIDGASSADIVFIGITSSRGYAGGFPYHGTWPLVPFLLEGLDAGSTTFTVRGRAEPGLLGDVLFEGTADVTVPASGRVQMWICPGDVEGASELAPTTIDNPDEGKPIPVIFGRMGDTHGHFAPCMVYDWGVTNEVQIRYVYVDYGDLNGDAIHPVSAGNHDVIMIDTQPPQSKTDADGNEVPIEGAHQFVDLATSIAAGEVYYLRRDGEDTVPGGLLTFHSPGGPGNRFGVFYLDTNIFNAWARVLFENEDIVFDPLRFKILTHGGGARTASEDVLAVFNPDRKEAIGNIIRLLVDHAGVPPDRIDLETAALLQDVGTRDVRRYITNSESVEELYAKLCQDAGLLSYQQAAGLVSWKHVNLSAPPPAVFKFDEARCLAGTMGVATNDWGPYFNAANGATEQGFPYQDDAGHITVSERTNSEAISANDGIKVSTTIDFPWIYDKQDMKDAIDEMLVVQGLPSHTYSVSVRAHDPTDDAAVDDLDAQLAVVGGDTLQSGYIASRIDDSVRRLISRGALAMCIGFDHDVEASVSTLTFWRFGFTAAASQSVMLIMDGTEEFPAELGGDPIGGEWNESWSDAQKAYAANYGSGVGGWISDDDAHVSTDDTSIYNTSLMG